MTSVENEAYDKIDEIFFEIPLSCRFGGFETICCLTLGKKIVKLVKHKEIFSIFAIVEQLYVFGRTYIYLLKQHEDI